MGFVQSAANVSSGRMDSVNDRVRRMHEHT